MYLCPSFIVLDVVSYHIEVALPYPSDTDPCLAHAPLRISSSHNKWCVLTHLACKILTQKTRLQFDTTSIGYFVLEDRMSNDLLHALLKLFEKETLGTISHAIAVELYLEIFLLK